MDHLVSTAIHKVRALTFIVRAAAVVAVVALSTTVSAPISARPDAGASFARAVVRNYGLDDRSASYAKTRVALTDADTHRLLGLTEENRSAFQAYLGGFKTFITTNRTRNTVFLARSCCDRQEWFVGRSAGVAPQSIAAVAQQPIRIAGVGLGDSTAAVVRRFGVPNVRTRGLSATKDLGCWQTGEAAA